jgi:hypothetical protein
VDDYLLPAREQVGPERVRGEHGMAARVVGDREDVDPRVGRQRSGGLDQAPAAGGGDHPSARHSSVAITNRFG